ncbi:hypothetical protein PM082_022012 [Marasmius tenuissimus]|nr:hypothetical protein PM082_022012 [Marasmius tenuissimus]
MSQSRTASSGSSSPAPDHTTGFIGLDDKANTGNNGDGEEDVEPGEDNDNKDIKFKDSKDGGVEDEDEDGEVPGRLGDMKYSFLKAQKQILMAKYPHYTAAEGGGCHESKIDHTLTHEFPSYQRAGWIRLTPVVISGAGLQNQ